MQTSRHPLPTRLISFTIEVYRNTLSYMMLGSCRFFPTCSEYALQAVERHGAIRGVVRAGSRVLRCHMFARGGVDPIDE